MIRSGFSMNRDISPSSPHPLSRLVNTATIAAKNPRITFFLGFGWRWERRKVFALRSRALAEARIATQNSHIRIAEKCGSREIRQRQGPHQRLSQLSNRIDGEEQAKIMGAVH